MRAIDDVRPFGSERFPCHVTVVEVGPRDGFQSEGKWIPTDEKIKFIKNLNAAGVREFEATSFVSARAVPQLADAASVIAGFPDRLLNRLKLTALVPNVKGATAAVEASVDAMVLFVSASQTHNQKNLNRSIGDSIAEFRRIAAVAKEASIPIQGAIATSFGCPFEGEVSLDAVMEIAKVYQSLGVRQITISDTTGMATPALVVGRCREYRRSIQDIPLSLHFHNTRGIGLVNVYSALCEGVAIFEASVGGIGGCPFAPGATGNIATEDLVYLLHELGIDTGIDLENLCKVSIDLERFLGRSLPGQVMKAGSRQRLHSFDAIRSARG
jgi:hydroxymethylglutaryl-CoA lyase